MNLSELSKDLQSKQQDKAEEKQKAAKERWLNIKELHPDAAQFFDLFNELTGAPKAMRMVSDDKVIYGAGHFSPARDFKLVLSRDYSWMDKPRKPKTYVKKSHY